MTTPYTFGMSQDDAATEHRALELRSGDRVLCIASAGEVPLNLAALAEVRVDAVDVSRPQLFLAKLKQAAANHLEPPDAARFIGYRHATPGDRRRLFQHLREHIDAPERDFWGRHPAMFDRGPIHIGRFERYLSRFSWIGLRILGRKRFLKLFELDEVQARQEFFDRHLASRRLQAVFRTAFHPRLYRKRGMVDQALQHSGSRDTAGFFFGRFRDFCTATSPRDNYFLQITFFGHVLFDHALPEFLGSPGNERLRDGACRVAFHHADLAGFLRAAPPGQYNRFALSNVGDWLSGDDFAGLLGLLAERSAADGRALLRYIHFDHPIPDSLRDRLAPLNDGREELERADRYPFYSLSLLRVGLRG